MPDLSTLSMPFNPAGIELDRRQGLSRQLYQALRLRVLDGRLASGTRLPASRDLAAALAISRNSVVRAYDQLYAEGFIEGRVGDGTYVAQLPRDPLKAKKTIHKSIHRVFNRLTHSLIHKLAGFTCDSIQ